MRQGYRSWNVSQASGDSKHADATETLQHKSTGTDAHFSSAHHYLRVSRNKMRFHFINENCVCISWNAFALENANQQNPKHLNYIMSRFMFANFPVWQCKVRHLSKSVSIPSSIYLMVLLLLWQQERNNKSKWRKEKKWLHSKFSLKLQRF